MRRIFLVLVSLTIGCSGDYRPYEYLSFADAEGAEVLQTSKDPSPNTWLPFAVPTVTRIVRDNYQFYLMLTEIDGRRVHVRAATLDGKLVLINSPYIWGPYAHESEFLPELGMSFLYEWVPGDPDIMEVNVVDAEGRPLWTDEITFEVRKRGMRHYPRGYQLHGEEL